MPHVPPPVIALAAAGVQRALAPARAPDDAPAVPSRVLALALATGVALGSAGLMGGAVRRFLAAGTTVDPTDPTRASVLVTDGPNALTRNPMYAGLAGLLTAHALARGGWATLLPVAGFVAVVDRVQVRPEEEALRGQFGAAYDDYRRRVRRWV